MLQLSLFDLCNENKTEETKILGNIDEPKENYLQRGERIFSLLRTKKQKVFVPSSIFERVNRSTYIKKSTYGRYEYLISCSEKLLRQKWEKACKDGKLELFFKEVGIKDVQVDKLDSSNDASLIIKEMRRKQTFEGVVKIQIGDDKENVYYAPMGKLKLTKKQHGRRWGWRTRGNTTWYSVIDVAKQYRYEYLYNELRNRIKSELEGLNEEQLQDNRILEFLLSSQLKTFKRYTNESGLIVFKKDALEEPYVKKFVKKHGYPVCVGDSSLYRIDCCDMLPIWFLSDASEAPYKTYLRYSSKLIVELFDLLSSLYLQDKQSDSFNKRVATDYARVYETKKAIPQKMINAMEKSSFNEYFGYVEFDAECDLEKISEIEKEFKALQDVVFHQDGKKEDVSLRFRKLGKHKAAGLYFPSLKCICIDVRYPSSMAHEYGHMLDYEAGIVSKGVKFSKVRFMYVDLFEKAMEELPKDDPVRIKLEGRTKYNKDYYLEPTEIFARSLELYLVEVLKVDNSLVKPSEVCEGRIAYPKDKEYLSGVAEFFDEFFEVQAHVAKAVASN